MARWILVLTLAASIAARDIAPDPVRRTGEALAPKKATAVAMAAETVTIGLHDDFAEVNAVFTMKNTSDKEETLDVGFPSAAQPEAWSMSNNGVDVTKWGSPSIYAFKAKVDGEEVKAESKDGRLESRVGFMGWLCWPMTFAAGQTRTVEVSYNVASKDDNYTDPSALQNRQVTYILKTGAGWKDAIGSAKIILNLNGMTATNLAKVAPEPTAKSDKAWTWEMKNFEPDADILVQYHAYADAKDALAKLTPLLEKTPNNAELLLDVAENLEADGQHEKAATTFAKLHEIGAAKKSPIFRHHTAYVPASYRAAKNFAAASKKEDAAKWAKTAIEALNDAVTQLEGKNIWARKSYRTSPEALKKLVKECEEIVGEY